MTNKNFDMENLIAESLLKTDMIAMQKDEFLTVTQRLGEKVIENENLKKEVIRLRILLGELPDNYMEVIK